MTKSYFPPLKLFCDALKINSAALKRSDLVPVPGNLLAALLAAAISDLKIDTDAYISDHPDLSASFGDDPVKKKSEDHFKVTGYLEGRLMPIEFDERYYLATNPDVAQAVKTSEVKNARYHFVNAGIFESRSPSLKAEKEVLFWRNILKAR